MKKQRSNTIAVVQQGFTLIELLVVVAVLATMAGIAASVVGNYDQQAREQLVHTEMKNIAKAIYRFKQDTGYFPREGIFKDEDTAAVKPNDRLTDMGFLYISPEKSGSTLSQWDAIARLGWNGPYLAPDSQQRLHSLDSSSQSYCYETATLNSITIGVHSVIAVADTFESIQANTINDVCFVIHDAGGWTPKIVSGNAYRYMTNFENTNYLNCDAAPGCIALLSAGPDGEYTGGVSVDVYSEGGSIGSVPAGGDGDDIVKILRVN